MIDFIVIGAQKCGTTALFHYLQNHPEIGMGNKKELHFFDEDQHFTSSPINYKLYESQFENKPSFKKYGEVTPSYIYIEPVMKRIYDYNPKIKLIAILRNPIDRAFSHWNMQINRKLESNNFRYCIINETARLQQGSLSDKRRYSYVSRGFYSEQISRINKYFSPQQILFIKYEDFIKEQLNKLTHIFDFLGVDNSVDHANIEEYFKTNYTSDLNKEDRKYLIDLYSRDIRKVELQLKWDCNDWLQPAI